MQGPHLLPTTFAALALVSLLGCTSLESATGGKVWYKPGGTLEERDRLLTAAKVQALQAHNTATPGAPDQPEARRQTERQTVLSAMTAAGWTLVPPEQAKPLDHQKKEPTSPPRALSSPTALDR
jgi:hypothetical protein